MRLRNLLLLLAALLLALSACGRDDDDQSSDAGSDAETDAGTEDTDNDAGADDTGTEDTSADPDTDAGTDPDADIGEDVFEDISDEDVAPPPTLQEIYTEIFEPSCGGAGCHLGPGGTAAPVLENDEGLMDRLLATSVTGSPMPFVTPGDPDESYLFRKLNDTFREVGGFGTLMPLAGMPLPDDEIDMVEAWILAGAPE